MLDIIIPGSFVFQEHPAVSQEERGKGENCFFCCQSINLVVRLEAEKMDDERIWGHLRVMRKYRVR